jgi:hypothetical protein
MFLALFQGANCRLLAVHTGIRGQLVPYGPERGEEQMRYMAKGLAVALLAAAPATLKAQEPVHTSGPTATLRALAAQPSTADRDRAKLSAFLNRADVQKVATDHGIDVRRLKEGVTALDDGTVTALVRQMRAVDHQPALVGGDTFVISSTAVIIALLVFILIEVS